MTIINDIEIDDIEYTKNTTKEAILNNDPIEDKLHVVIVVSNPCLYASRYILAREFIKRFDEEEHDAILYVVELTYGKQKFLVTEKGNPRHLQVNTDSAPIWSKENMINMGVRHLLPPTWKAFAWIDADLEFENPSWAKDTLRVLNGSKDIVQLFSHAVDMDENKLTMNVFNSWGYQYAKEKPYCGKGPNFWHPGFAWACTRKAYERMGGIYEKAILGSGDNIMAFCLIKNGLKAVNPASHPDYLQSVLDFQERVKNLRLGYVPGVIRHHYHGSKKDRKYSERWQILISHQYDATSHIRWESNGLLVPSSSCPPGLLADILGYFRERNEDASRKGIKETVIQRQVLAELTPIVHKKTCATRCNIM